MKCGKAGMLEVDHVQSIADAGEVWDNDNLQVLCRGCHIEKTRSENLARHGKPPPNLDGWHDLVEELR